MNNSSAGNYVVPSLIFAILFSATPAFAQVYYPNYASTASCTTLTRDMSVGSRNSEVLTLQRFLVAQNYPGGGNWMLTGYFGRATEQAVRNFEQQAGLYVTGTVNAATRSAIQNASCGGSIYPNYNYTYPTYQSYSGCQYYNCEPQSGSLSITYISPNAGAVGSVVTIYGYGFSTEGNTVHLGNGIIANIRSFDGRSLSFTVPAQLSGYGTQMTQLMTYNLYVTNQLGQNSNSTQFTVTSLANSGIRPTISAVSGPTTITTGTSGTWSVTVTAPSAYASVTMNVTWGDENLYGNAQLQVAQQYFVNGTQTFTFTHTYANAGTYTPTFTVSNSAGSNASSASVYISGSSQGSVTLNTLSPSQGQKGTQIQLFGSGFTANDNVVHFGIGGLRNVSSVNGTVIYYTIPQYVSACDLIIGSGCSASATQVVSGTYPMYVTNSNGTTQTLNFSVVQ